MPQPVQNRPATVSEAEARHDAELRSQGYSPVNTREVGSHRGRVYRKTKYRKPLAAEGLGVRAQGTALSKKERAARLAGGIAGTILTAGQALWDPDFRQATFGAAASGDAHATDRAQKGSVKKLERAGRIVGGLLGAPLLFSEKVRNETVKAGATGVIEKQEYYQSDVQGGNPALVDPEGTTAEARKARLGYNPKSNTDVRRYARELADRGELREDPSGHQFYVDSRGAHSRIIFVPNGHVDEAVCFKAYDSKTGKSYRDNPEDLVRAARYLCALYNQMEPELDRTAQEQADKWNAKHPTDLKTKDHFKWISFVIDSEGENVRWFRRYDPMKVNTNNRFKGVELKIKDWSAIKKIRDEKNTETKQPLNPERAQARTRPAAPAAPAAGQPPAGQPPAQPPVTRVGERQANGSIVEEVD